MEGTRRRAASIEVEQVVDAVKDAGVATPTEIAAALGCHVSTVTRKLDAAVRRGMVIVDDHNADGRYMKRPFWRYTLKED
jgi:DNA-binding MarR family transcriptional regulator